MGSTLEVSFLERFSKQTPVQVPKLTLHKTSIRDDLESNWEIAPDDIEERNPSETIAIEDRTKGYTLKEAVQSLSKTV